MLHLAPVTGDISYNRSLVESAVKVAAAEGADWAITPELCVPGYRFMERIGSDWILPQPDPWMQDFCGLVRQLKMTVFLSHPEREAKTNRLYNTVFVIGPQGGIMGKYQKMRPVGKSEAWSSPGETMIPVECDAARVGILICADSYKKEVAQTLKEKGAQMLVSPVAWGPGDCGPKGEWEQRTVETGIPILVCNRSGVEDEDLDFRLAESIVAKDGQRLLSATSDRSVVLTFDWDVDGMAPLSLDYQRVYL